MIVLEGGVSTPLTAHIASELDVPFFQAEISSFSAGEWSVTINPKNIKNKSIILVHGMHTPANMQPLSGHAGETISLHNAFMLSLFIARRTKQHGAKQVVMICPFMPYGRQDQGESLSFFHMILDLMHASGIDQVMTLDAHSIPDPASCPLPLININSTPLWAQRFDSTHPPTVIAPDKGGQERASLLVRALDAENNILLLTKHRSANGVCLVQAPILPQKSSHYILLDDILDTGSTLCGAINALGEVRPLSLCITHGLWSNDCSKRMQSLNIEKIYVTDSVTCARPMPPCTTVIPCAPLLAQSIQEHLQTHRTTCHRISP